METEILMSGGSKIFGDYIKDLRNKKKEHDNSFSVRGLADKIGLSATYVSKIERGELPASDDAVYRLAKALEVTPDELFAQAGKIDPNLEKQIAAHAAPVKMAAFLRTASGLSQERLDMYQRMIDAAEGNAPKPDKGEEDAEKI
jgi:predicted transcriptional regulator